MTEETLRLLVLMFGSAAILWGISRIIASLAMMRMGRR